MVPPIHPWSVLDGDVRWAEQVGYDTLYVYDHLTHPTVPGRWLGEAFATLAAAAGATERIGLGTLVASATLHSPVSLARRAGTVQDVSGGRLVLGLGAGSPRCAAADRGDDMTAKQMVDRLEDVVVGLQAVWEGATEWTGRTRSFRGLETTALPQGVTRPPLVLAAHGPRTLRLAARYADAWNTYGGPEAVALEPGEYWALIARQCARMDDICAEAGRSVPRSLLLGYGQVRPADSVPSYLEAIERAGELGFDELVVYGPQHEGDPFASDAAVHERVLARR